jgi:hypothetical protein
VERQTATLRRQSDALKAHWEKLLEETGYGTAFGKN